MTSRRRRWNSICSKIARPHDVEDHVPRKSREQLLVEVIMEECRKHGLSEVDDICSDLILELWEDTSPLDFDHIRGRVRSSIRWAFVRRRSRHRKTLFFCDMPADLENDEGDLRILSLAVSGGQEIHMEALYALDLVEVLPKNERDSLMILADGGNPLDVAAEMGIEPWDAIRLIRRARGYVHRVEPKRRLQSGG